MIRNNLAFSAFILLHPFVVLSARANTQELEQLVEVVADRLHIKSIGQVVRSAALGELIELNRVGWQASRMLAGNSQ